MIKLDIYQLEMCPVTLGYYSNIRYSELLGDYNIARVTRDKIRTNEYP
jgi:hypothetical protein